MHDDRHDLPGWRAVEASRFEYRSAAKGCGLTISQQACSCIVSLVILAKPCSTFQIIDQRSIQHASSEKRIGSEVLAEAPIPIPRICCKNMAMQKREHARRFEYRKDQLFLCIWRHQICLGWIPLVLDGVPRQ